MRRCPRLAAPPSTGALKTRPGQVPGSGGDAIERMVCRRKAGSAAGVLCRQPHHRGSAASGLTETPLVQECRSHVDVVLNKGQINDTTYAGLGEGVIVLGREKTTPIIFEMQRHP